MFHESFMEEEVSRMFHDFQGCFKSVSMNKYFYGSAWSKINPIKGDPRVFKRCFKGVPRVFQKVFQGSFKKTFRVFQKVS